MGRSVDECLRARTTGGSAGFSVRDFWRYIPSSFGIGGEGLRRRAADSQGRPPRKNESLGEEANGSSPGRIGALHFPYRQGIAGTRRFPRGSGMDPDCEFLKSIFDQSREGEARVAWISRHYGLIRYFATRDTTLSVLSPKWYRYGSEIFILFYNIWILIYACLVLQITDEGIKKIWYYYISISRTVAKYPDSSRYMVSSDCKAEGIDRYDAEQKVRRCRSHTLYDFTRVTRVCINKAPFWELGGPRRLWASRCSADVRRRYINP